MTAGAESFPLGADMKNGVTLRGRGSFRTEVEAGAHRWILDEPVSAGGEDAGPTPYDMLAAALGGCVVMTLHFYAKREGLPLEAVSATVRHDREHARDCADCVTKTGFIHRFSIELQLDGPLDAGQREKLLEIAGRCPVAKTLSNEIRIDKKLVG